MSLNFTGLRKDKNLKIHVICVLYLALCKMKSDKREDE